MILFLISVMFPVFKLAGWVSDEARIQRAFSVQTGLFESSNKRKQLELAVSILISVLRSLGLWRTLMLSRTRWFVSGESIVVYILFRSCCRQADLPQFHVCDCWSTACLLSQFSWIAERIVQRGWTAFYWACSARCGERSFPVRSVPMMGEW